MKTILLSLLAIAATSLVFAQTALPTEPSAIERQPLERWLGDWTFETTTLASPLGTGGTNVGACSVLPLLAGQSGEFRDKATGPQENLRRIESDGFDPARGGFFWDSLAGDTAVSDPAYTFDGTRVSMVGTLRARDKRYLFRSLVTFANDFQSFTNRREISADGMHWTLLGESRAAKVMPVLAAPDRDTPQAAPPEATSPRAGSLAPTPRAALSPLQQQWLAKAHRHEKAGWIYLHIEGVPRERGFQHGYLLSKEIAEGLRLRKTVWYHDTALEWADLLKETARFLTPFVDPENREELLGLVDGLQAAGIATTLDELVAHNAAMELGYWWAEVSKTLSGGATVVTTPTEHCSSFIATGSMTRVGGVVLAHNTMGSYVEATCNVILDLVPTQGHRILMQAVPGWIHSGTDFFITDAGLVGSETTIGGFSGFTEWGIPEFVRMRRATQDAATIDQWCEIMKKSNNGGYANAWLLGDVNTGEIARLELGLANVALERTRDGFFIGSNVAENLKLLRRETNVNECDIRYSSVARRVRWKQLMAQNRGKIDVALAEAFEADHYDPFARKDRPGGRSLCGHGETEADWGPEPWAIPFAPGGTVDAKVVDAAMAKRMSFAARWGSACGRRFDARQFLADHPQFDWMDGLLQDLPSEPWVEFTAGEKP